ncbi:MAG: 4-hydroxy-tetrahydrodipicolinate reductase [Treponema sp.]|uniref:4-hydroxy-tetrahydrodipicolinate reductase n=1 Tax=Treponema sp. TaxID=166 RepID=UPI00298E3678|nr:4-hydroxy-tetrahydrodipicolinate reductase [Treponema sp.]MBR0155745.1 4-hydroxy-tetrahydrodipicolinate reductase [Treponema sp.]MCR5386133.1 4-hydroxy-tetrahydrodipicolinate reductase [Treponema sp.]
MKIAIVGFGKMGHMIKSSAENFGHEVVATVDPVAKDADCKVEQGDYEAVAKAVKESGAEGIIEFSHPSAVMGNIKALIPLGLPLVIGTTGWNDKKDEIRNLLAQCNGIAMTSANFSIGVNLLYKIIDEAAKLVSAFDEYDASVFEIHHNQKADSPSGTALDIAKHLMANYPKKTEIVTESFHERPKANELHVASMRLGSVPGTHTVFFDSNADTIEITHRARSREGFANGAVHSLERLAEGIKNGSLQRGKLFEMSDLF